MRKAGLLKCVVRSTYHWGQIELHHDKVEFAHVADVDVEKFNAEYGLHLSDEDFTRWVEEEGNLEPLCVTGESRVLMADGRRKRIDRIRAGEQVICHQGHAHPVSAVMAREVDEPVYELQGARLTGAHPVLTKRGFASVCGLPAGEIVCQFGMLASNVLRVRAVKNKVLRLVIKLVVVSVVHSFVSMKTTAKQLLHHITVLEHLPVLITGPHPQTNVALRGDLARAQGLAFARQGVEGAKPTVVAAIPSSRRSIVRLSFKRAVAPFTAQHHGRFAATFTRALVRARRISAGKLRSNQKQFSTHNAGFRDAPCAFAAWRPIGKPRVSRHRGRVYNLDVTGCHTFIAGSLAVHNCTLHHRGQEGVHSLPEPQWRLLRVAKASRHVFMVQSNTGIPVQRRKETDA